MALNRSLLVARLLWLAPGILLFLTINQGLVAVDLRETVGGGDLVSASIVEYSMSDRADITMATVRLSVPMPDGAIEERELPLPITFVRKLQAEVQDSVHVYVAPGADQEVVIAEIGRAQWRLAAINSGICLLGFLLASWGIWSWTRYLTRRGDPAQTGA